MAAILSRRSWVNIDPSIANLLYIRVIQDQSLIFSVPADFLALNVAKSCLHILEMCDTKK